jgi:hypothetical protein
MHAPKYVDHSPHTIYAMLLDIGIYLASVATLYRILRATGETRPRRNGLTHPAYPKPELCKFGAIALSVLPIILLLRLSGWCYGAFFFCTGFSCRLAGGGRRCRWRFVCKLCDHGLATDEFTNL